MTFSMVEVRSRDQAPDTLFPSMAPPGAGPRVAVEPGDGTVSTVPVREVAVRTQLDGHVREVVHVRRHGAELMITDTRVVVSSTHVASRSIVAGHLRYPWLVAVGGSRAHGRHGLAELRMIVRCLSDDYAVLTLGFEVGEDVGDLAAAIAGRAGRNWLRQHPDAPGERRSRWEAIAAAQPTTAPMGEFALHWMPEYERVPAAANSGLLQPM
jgi:hypothetical protein